MVEFVSFAQSTRLLAGCGEATRFAVLVHRVNNPTDARVFANDLVLRIDKDDFKVFVRRILVDPVRVENSEIGAPTTNSLFSSRLERSLVFELIDTLICWLAVCGTLWHWSLATTSSDTDTVDHIALLGLVTEATSFIRSRRSCCAVDNIELSELPAADSEEESKNIGLLLLLKFLDILEGAHLDKVKRRST